MGGRNQYRKMSDGREGVFMLGKRKSERYAKGGRTEDRSREGGREGSRKGRWNVEDCINNYDIPKGSL